MDIPRPDFKRKQRLKTLIYSIVAVIVVVTAAIFLSRLEPAAPTVPRASVWIEPVREGEMLRQVRGPGNLVPREIRWISAQASGRVERIVIKPGAVVTPDTVIIEMSNADLLLQVEEARLTLEGAEAELVDTERKLRIEQLNQAAALEISRADYEGALLEAQAQEELYRQGIVAGLDFRRAERAALQAQLRLEVEEERLAQSSASMEAQIASQRLRITQAQNALDRTLDQVRALHVMAGVEGVLQEISVEEGQRAEFGSNIGRVARPDDLMAELRIPETQARDVQIGQRVDVDTRNGIVEGVVTRIDPAVTSGTVQVDVELVGELPRGARPDLSVDGTIEIERLEDVVYMGRAANSQSQTTIGIFKVDIDGEHAIRVPVELGRTSVNSVEVIHGLVAGDEVILSDTSSWEDYDRIRLN